MIDGVKISLGGVEYVVPPLNLRLIKSLRPVFERLSGNTDLEDMLDAVVEVAHAALTRNYPSITKDILLDGIDLGNAKMVLDAVMSSSGLVSTSSSGSKSTGE